MTKKYIFECSIVVFLDILGFKELTKNEEMKFKILDLLYKFRDFNRPSQEQCIKNEQGGLAIDIKPSIISFSDHIILSIPY